MNRIRLVVIGIVLTFGLTTVAQQSTTSSDGSALPPVEKHLKVLTDRLDLTGDQQVKVRPILQEMQDTTEKFTQDESMSREERMDNVKACRYKADRELRKILSDEQKKKLDQLEETPHPDLHGN